MTQLPSGWQWTALPKLGFLGRGISKHRPRYAGFLYGGPYPFFQTGDIKAATRALTDYHQTYSERGLAQSKLWPAGTLCITIAANIAEIAILGVDACFPDSVVGFVGDPSLCDVRYIFYYLTYTKTDVRKFAIGSVQDNINLEILRKFPISLPSLAIQRRIADILGALDDKIECNRRINQTLEALAQALYKHWFVDTSESEIRPITDLIQVDPPVEIPRNREVPFVEMKALPIWSMSVTDVIRRRFAGGSKFRNGDTLLAAITPSLENGKTAFVDFLEEDEAGWGSTEFIILRAKQGVSPQFVYCSARDESLRTRAIKSMVGSSGRQRVRRDFLDRSESKVYSEQTMQEFDERTLPWFKHIRANVKENQTLARTRDYLLPKLLSGEVVVRAAEKHVAAII